MSTALSIERTETTRTPTVIKFRLTPEPEIVQPSAAEPLVWRSPQSGAVLLDGMVMTRQRAVHACLTHSRNVIHPEQTTATRITYRTPSGRVCVYEGTRPWTGRELLHRIAVGVG